MVFEFKGHEYRDSRFGVIKLYYNTTAWEAFTGHAIGGIALYFSCNWKSNQDNWKSNQDNKASSPSV